MPRALLFLLTTISLFGQFYGLSTNNDGMQLYFSTSLQLTGTTNENPYYKIFRYDGTGLHLVAQVDKVAISNQYGVLTSAYNLEAGYISGDGSVVGYVGYADCGGSARGCVNILGIGQTTLFYPGFTTTLPYGCTISGNAQYAACETAPGLHYGFDQYSVYNLFASSQTPAYVALCYSEQGANFPALLSSDGHFLCGTTLWSASGPTTVNLQGNLNPYTELLSDDGSRIVTYSDNSLFSYNVATGTTSAVPFPDGIHAGIRALSSHGSVVLFQVVKNSKRWRCRFIEESYASSKEAGNAAPTNHYRFSSARTTRFPSSNWHRRNIAGFGQRRLRRGGQAAARPVSYRPNAMYARQQTRH